MVINNMANVEMKTENQLMTISLKGHIDSNNAGDAEAAIIAAIEAEKPENILIDAQELDYISSAGLRVLLRLLKKAKKEGREFTVAGAGGVVETVLTDSNMDTLLNMRKSLDEL